MFLKKLTSGKNLVSLRMCYLKWYSDGKQASSRYVRLYHGSAWNGACCQFYLLLPMGIKIPEIILRSYTADLLISIESVRFQRTWDVPETRGNVHHESERKFSKTSSLASECMYTAPFSLTLFGLHMYVFILYTLCTDDNKLTLKLFLKFFVCIQHTKCILWG